MSKTDPIPQITRSLQMVYDSAYLDERRDNPNATPARLTAAAVYAALHMAVHNRLLVVPDDIEERLEGWTCIRDCGETHGQGEPT